jgi:hypothetical protein
MNFDSLFATTNPREQAVEVIKRFQSTKRWHLVDTYRQQTLAEHSANVAMLAGYISVTCPQMYFGNYSIAVATALVHDIGEVLLGDLPTPTKQFVKGMDDLETNATPTVFRRFVTNTPDIKMLVKLCDLADGIRFIALYGIGTTAKHAEKGLRAQLNLKIQDMINNVPSVVVAHVNQCIAEYMVP